MHSSWRVAMSEASPIDRWSLDILIWLAESLVTILSDDKTVQWRNAQQNTTRNNDKKINVSYISTCKADTMRGDSLSNVIRIFTSSDTYLLPFIKLLINVNEKNCCIKQSSSIPKHCYFIGIGKKPITIISVNKIILSNFISNMFILFFKINKIISLDWQIIFIILLRFLYSS